MHLLCHAPGFRMPLVLMLNKHNRFSTGKDGCVKRNGEHQPGLTPSSTSPSNEPVMSEVQKVNLICRSCAEMEKIQTNCEWQFIAVSSRNELMRNKRNLLNDFSSEISDVYSTSLTCPYLIMSSNVMPLSALPHISTSALCVCECS